MLEYIDLEKILMLDIETVPQQPDYHDLPEKFKELWVKKAETFIKNNESPTPAENCYCFVVVVVFRMVRLLFGLDSWR